MKCILFVTGCALCTGVLEAQVTKPIPRDTVRDSVEVLQQVKVTATGSNAPRVAPLLQLTLPATTSITARKIDQSVNLVDPEDAVKYLPSVFLRKRNYGDTQATLETRVWGVSSSARSLVFADGVPINALIANNNNIGAPRWGVISSDEIERVDVMFGPYSAAYAGNSMGAVVEITTRTPQKAEGSISQTTAIQSFDLYGTSRDYATYKTSATFGDRFGKFSFRVGGDYENSQSQPLSYVTSTTLPAGTTGGFLAQNKLGAPADILGASGLLHTGMMNATVKLAYDFTPFVRAAYTLGYWTNDGVSSVDPYSTTAGAETFAGQSGFASGYYRIQENHTSQSLSLRTDSHADWDYEVVGTLYNFDKDHQLSPLTASAAGTTFGTTGRLALLDGTGWGTIDLNASWHPGGVGGSNALTFGVHDDGYTLFNPTYNLSDWTSGGSRTGVATEGDGKTRTEAVWVQDSWRIIPSLRLTVGGRYENWKAFDGFNSSGGTQVVQPIERSTKFSPKAVLAWTSVPDWTLTASVGKAYRFATASELYQLVSTGTTFTSPDPNLKPDNVLAAEFRVERRYEHGSAQVSLFQDDVHDAIISQFLPLVANSPTLFSFLSNVDHVRARGVEAVLTSNDAVVRGLELSGTVTYVDARTLAASGRASATAPAGTVVGKRLPNIPDWRASYLATYHVNSRLSLTTAGRYSGQVFTTLDNSDINPNTYQGFSDWFVADARGNYRVNPSWTASVGVDNLLDRKYFFFHPFPQRTLVASLKYGF